MEDPEEDMRPHRWHHQLDDPGGTDESRQHRPQPPQPHRPRQRHDPSEVNNLLKQFNAMSGMMQQMAGMGMMDRVKMMRQMASGGMMDPGGNLKAMKGSSKSTSPNARALAEKKKKQRKDAKKQKKRNR